MRWLQKGRGEVGFSLHVCTQTCSGQVMRWLHKGRGEVGFSLHVCTQTCSGQVMRWLQKGRGDVGFSLHGRTQTCSGQVMRWLQKGRGDVGFSLHGCTLILVRPDQTAARQGWLAIRSRIFMVVMYHVMSCMLCHATVPVEASGL